MRLILRSDLEKAAFVSIHASVKDATVRETDAKVNLSVSIHASVKDATLYSFDV